VHAVRITSLHLTSGARSCCAASVQEGSCDARQSTSAQHGTRRALKRGLGQKGTAPEQRAYCCQAKQARAPCFKIDVRHECRKCAQQAPLAISHTSVQTINAECKDRERSADTGPSGPSGKPTSCTRASRIIYSPKRYHRALATCACSACRRVLSVCRLRRQPPLVERGPDAVACAGPRITRPPACPRAAKLCAARAPAPTSDHRFYRSCQALHANGRLARRHQRSCRGPHGRGAAQKAGAASCNMFDTVDDRQLGSGRSAPRHTMQTVRMTVKGHTEGGATSSTADA